MPALGERESTLSVHAAEGGQEQTSEGCEYHFILFPHHWIPGSDLGPLLLHQGFVVHCVHTPHTRAVEAWQLGSEAITIEFQALALLAVASFSVGMRTKRGLAGGLSSLGGVETRMVTHAPESWSMDPSMEMPAREPLFLGGCMESSSAHDMVMVDGIYQARVMNGI